MSSSHIFALFSTGLPEHITNNMNISFSDSDVWQRITQVLRLVSGDKIILFNHIVNTLLVLDHSTFSNKKNMITGVVGTVHHQASLTPAVHLIVGLTKREAFEDLVYSCAQMGVTTITPILTERIHRNWLTEKDSVRLKKIMIAACEQGKQFVLPMLRQPSHLDNILLPSMPNTFLCSPNGEPLLIMMQKISRILPQELTLFVGPEGGLDDDEEQKVAHSGIEQVALGKSILRTQDAVQLIVGAMRSLKL